MIRLLYKIWPSLIPIALLLLWYVVKYQRVKKNPDIDNPKLKDEPWRMTLIIAAIIAIICIFTGVLAQDNVKGDYVPASIQGGKISDGQITQP